MINVIHSANTEYLLKRLYEIDDKLKDFFTSAHNADILMIEKEQIITELKQRKDSNKTLNSKNSLSGLSDRQQLDQLQAKKKQIENKIKEITTHRTGLTYGKMLCQLIQQYITDTTNIKDRISRYSLYSKIRGDISKQLEIKTQTYTRSEYNKALYIIESTLNYKIPEDFKD